MMLLFACVAFVSCAFGKDIQPSTHSAGVLTNVINTHILDRLMERIDKQEERINELENENRRLVEKRGLDGERLSQLAEDVRTLQVQSKVGRVAFMAIKTDGEMTSSSGNQVIIYDKEIYNGGGAYNPESGKFTCPMSGVFSFCFSIYSGDILNGEWSTGAIVKNGDTLTTVYQRNSNDRLVTMDGAACAVVQAEANDQIWVKFGWSGSKIYGRGSITPAFSGFLLFAM